VSPASVPSSNRPAPANAKAAAKAAAPKRPRKAVKRRRKPDPIKAWAKRLERTRPGLVRFVMDGLAERYGHPAWVRRMDPTAELILTILTQNSADTNAELAFEALRKAYPSAGPVERHVPGPGWGGKGLTDGVTPDWALVDAAPLEELVEVIRPGGLPNGKARGIKAALRAIHEARGDYSLEFLGEMTALGARSWLTAINGIGVKTASVVLLFSFGMPLMPVDRHVERVARRVGLVGPKLDANQAHDVFLALLQPDEMHEAHVNLIQHGRLVCHSQRPAHELCPLISRCRFVDPKAP
jgi:endonuclease III